jgi:hypothetical protein
VLLFRLFLCYLGRWVGKDGGLGGGVSEYGIERMAMGRYGMEMGMAWLPWDRRIRKARQET